MELMKCDKPAAAGICDCYVKDGGSCRAADYSIYPEGMCEKGERAFQMNHSCDNCHYNGGNPNRTTSGCSYLGGRWGGVAKGKHICTNYQI